MILKHFETESIGNVAAKIWNKILNETKEVCSLAFFKSKIKKWVPEGFLCRFCKTYVGLVSRFSDANL